MIDNINEQESPNGMIETHKIKIPKENKEPDDDFLEDLLDLPGTIKKARTHASARRILDVPEKFPEGAIVEFCDDCNLPIECAHVKKFKCTVNPKKLASAGYGVYLYFFFINYLIINIVALIIIVAIPYAYLTQGYSNELFNFCTRYFNNVTTPVPPETDFAKCINFNNKKEFDYTSFDWLNVWSGETVRIYVLLLEYIGKTEDKNELVPNFHLISFCCLLFLLVANMLFINLSSAIVNEIDFNEESPSDYSLMISDIPTYENTPERIKEFLECKNISIHEVNCTYKMTHVKQAKNELNEFKRLKRMNKGKKTYKKGFLCFKKEYPMKELTEKIKIKSKETKELESEKDVTFNGLAFIVFNKQDDQELYYKQYPNSFLAKVCINLFSMIGLVLCSCCLSPETKKRWKRKVKIAVARAPEPQDIIWENLEYHFVSRFLRSCVGYFVSIVCIGISFGLVLLLNWGQSTAEKKLENDIILKYGLSMCISLVIQIINYIVFLIFSYFAMFEKPWSYTDYYLSLSIKLTAFTFLNSAIVPLVSNIIQYGSDNQEILVNNMLMMFLMAGVLSPILSITCYDYLMGVAFQWLFELNHKDPFKAIPEKTQRELNELYEYPDMSISYKYSQLFMPFLMACFYMSIFPLGTVICLFGAILTYFVEKIKFTQIYKKPKMFNHTLCYFYIDHFGVALFVYSVGHWIFLNNILKINVFEYLNIILFGILVIIPYKKPLRMCDTSGAYASTNEVSFEDAYFSFQFDYERLNPKTQKQGMINYLTRLKNIHLINDEQYKILLEKMHKINVMEIYHGMTNPIPNTIARKTTLPGSFSNIFGFNKPNGAAMMFNRLVSSNNISQSNTHQNEGIQRKSQIMDDYNRNMQLNNIKTFLMNMEEVENRHHLIPAENNYDDDDDNGYHYGDGDGNGNGYNNVQVYNPQPVQSVIPPGHDAKESHYSNGNYYVPQYNNEINGYLNNKTNQNPNEHLDVDQNMLNYLNINPNVIIMNHQSKDNDGNLNNNNNLNKNNTNKKELFNSINIGMNF